ncbi:thioredoxin reductase 1, mitochondrial [Lucilia sericata]|uniref:thioredoxin reductase 1, mitochondrial n=1 Tax=Lucilia sericata TaxID=13632 RepID=UPI0018A7F48D|nr:thioredoxin reductase 1, mitochondrial [Lucilia sericata]
MSIVPHFDFDIIVIGGGSGGLACAKEANELGAKVLCIDYVKSTPKNTSWGIGGTCVNVGCIPKKLMHEAALLGEAIHDATSYGWKITNEEDITLNWNNLVTEVQNQIKSTNWIIRVELRTKNIKYLNGTASFIDNHTIQVKMKDGSQVKHTGHYIVIAVGLRPVYPNIPGAREYGITSDDLFSWPKPPGKTLIVGAGYISMECAGFLRLFGFDVTVMVRDKILRNFDRQMVNIITDSLKERGIKFLMPYKPLKVEQLETGRLLVKYENVKLHKKETDTFDTVIWATGRKGELEDLNIEAVNLKTDDNLLVVNEEECTNVENIYAVGDITKGRPQLTPVAVMAGRLLAQRLFSHSSQKLNYENVASTLFTPLEYAFVGMSEETAIQKFGEENIEIYHNHYNPLEFSLPEKVVEFCYIKIIAQREGQQLILGIHYVGPNAGNVMQGFSVAFNCGLNTEILFNTVGVNVTNAQEITSTYITKRSGLDPTS